MCRSGCTPHHLCKKEFVFSQKEGVLNTESEKGQINYGYVPINNIDKRNKITNAERVKDPAEVLHGRVVQFGGTRLVSRVGAEGQASAQRKGNMQGLGYFPDLNKSPNSSLKRII